MSFAGENLRNLNFLTIRADDMNNSLALAESHHPDKRMGKTSSCRVSQIFTDNRFYQKSYLINNEVEPKFIGG